MKLQDIFESVNVVEQECLKTQQFFIISIFCDLQYAIIRIKVMDYKENKALKAQIYQKLRN